MTDTALRRVAVVLAAVAVAAVLAAGGLAGQRYAARDDTTAPPPTTPTTQAPSVEVPSPSDLPTPTAFPGGHIVFGFAQRDAVYEAPRGWTTLRGYNGLSVADDHPAPDPQADDPSRYGEGWCAKDESEQRAFVGWGPSMDLGSDVERANRAVLRSWRDGYQYDVNPRYYFPPRSTPPRRITLGDGTVAWLSTITGAIRNDDCPSLTASETTVLSFANTAAEEPRSRITHLVGYRNIGTGRDVSQAQVVRILRTARVVDQ